VNAARKKERKATRGGASHGMLVNACALLLEWCQPFCPDEARARKIHGDFGRLSVAWWVAATATATNGEV
jgi:hypothetical protein